jgi:hemolysin activation/secretion protein
LQNIHTDYLESELYVDRLTVANISTEYNLSDRFGGANLMQIKINQGLADFGASANGSAYLSRSQGRNNFTDMVANVGRLQTLTSSMRIYLAAEGQYTWSPLLSSEQFGFGGQQFGRAYDTSELTGDNGIAGSAEFRYSLPSFLPKIASEVFTFYDIGRIWNYHEYESSALSAASTGIGLRLNAGDSFSAVFTIAQPLTKRVNTPEYGDGQNPRVFGSVSYTF